MVKKLSHFPIKVCKFMSMVTILICTCNMLLGRMTLTN